MPTFFAIRCVFGGASQDLDVIHVEAAHTCFCVMRDFNVNLETNVDLSQLVPSSLRC